VFLKDKSLLKNLQQKRQRKSFKRVMKAIRDNLNAKQKNVNDRSRIQLNKQRDNLSVRLAD